MSFFFPKFSEKYDYSCDDYLENENSAKYFIRNGKRKKRAEKTARRPAATAFGGCS